MASTPNETEMQKLRQKTLEKLVTALLAETRRLGYTPAELRAALAEHWPVEGKENNQHA